MKRNMINMNNIMMKLFMVILLMMFSMGVNAKVDVELNKEYKGGKVKVKSQEDQPDGSTLVTITVAPDQGFTITHSDKDKGVIVYAVRPTSGQSGTRAPEISSELEVTGPTGTVSYPNSVDYQFTVPSGLNAWVQSADFQIAKRGDGAKGDSGYSGTWYLQNKQDNNNYYLVPCMGGGYYNNNEDKPYLTTYQTNQDMNSLWRLEKETIDGTDYYRIIHNATGLYVTFNEAVLDYSSTTNNAARLRLHLEAFDSPTDATLFYIQPHTSNGNIAIRPKDGYDEVNNYYWWDIGSGNKGNYWNNDYQGALGLWWALDAAEKDVCKWNLITANPTCATPVITYDESAGSISLSYPIAGDGGVTIYYTTDGSKPTSSSSTYSAAFSATGVTMVRAIAVKTGYDNSAEAVLYGPLCPYLFKTTDEANVSYYMIPPTDDDRTSDLNVTTSNVPNERMQWYLKPAALRTGVQYYYFVNAVTNKYAYCNVNENKANALLMKALGEDDTESDRYMFRIIDYGTYLNIVPKHVARLIPSSNNRNCLRKANATDHTNPIGLYQDDGGLSRWTAIALPDDPKSLFPQPSDMVSSSTNSVYFKLRNATQDDSSNDYFVYPPASAAYATAATTGSNPEWFFVEATDADTWNTYYQIRNAQTGDYLYFDSETRYNNNDNKFLTSSGITSGSEDKYKFLILKTANTTYSGTWHIVPKVIRNNNNQANIALSRENKSSAKLRSSNSRGNSNACWYLDAVDFKCTVPTFQYVSGQLTITTSTADAVIYYALGITEPTISEDNKYTGPITLSEGSSTVTAIAVRNTDGSDRSDAATFVMEIVTSGSQITNMNGYYTLGSNFTPSNVPIGTEENPFCGTIDGQFNEFSLSHPLFGYVKNATIKNVIISSATVNTSGNAGAIANNVLGDSRIYNCGVLSANSTIKGTENVGSIVGLLDGTSRVINCYSYATVSGGSMMGGIVGRNNQTSTMSIIKTIVVNCMFYGEISGASPGSAYPVYGGNLIDNSGTNAINNYNYFRSEADFDDVYTAIGNYNRSWPAEEKYLTRFEYYRSILNSNRHLCTYWVTDKQGTEQTAADTALIAKWVLDPSKAPYPILKKWGKYPSVINPDPTRTWRPQAKDADGVVKEAQWVTRTAAKDYEGKKLGTLKVTINAGTHHAGSVTSPISDKEFIIMDMDTLNHDYGYAKIQLPYYNELFGDPTADASQWDKRYGGNYKNYVVTGWEITSITGGTDISDKAGTDADGVDYDHTFTANWESGYNFADRYCTEKDKFSKSGRVFAQGGYYYVPEGVTAITITAHWGTAVYVRNKDNSIDRINTTADVESNNKSVSFSPAGTLPSTFQGQTVFTSIQNAIKSSSFSNLAAGKTVYDQAVVLVGNIQVRNGSSVVNYSGTNAVPYTLMSADFDLDNEPDFCLQLQFRNDLNRPRIQPVRFDFLSIPELGLAIRPDNKAWAIGIMVPAGHFEITETACMHTTQFEYDANITKVESPVILNGGHFEQVVVRYGSTSNNGISDRTSYFIMGGHFWMRRFTPGAHTNTGSTPKIRHCAVSVMGGEFPEFYLSGIYRTIVSNVDNPHCYINGGRFGTIAGAGMEQISGNITFKIDHAIIDEFYGGGINASLPVLGNIDVTIDHSRVGKYCGGPKVGILGTTSAYKIVTTHATGSTFNEYYGGGNGGTSYYREQKKDGDAAFPSQSASGWKDYGYSGFNPLNTISSVTKASDNSATNKGYHAEYEFEVFNNSNGTTDQAVVRAYYQWAQFGTTATGTVTNFLKDCTVNGNFYGGGNLGNVNGNVNTTLTGETHIVGSAFAAGYSAAIPKFRIHDKENATTSNFPARDFAGVITEHTLDYKKDDSGNEIYYTWSNELPPGTTSSNAKDNPTFQKDGKWYCYTWESLEGLGTVSGNATLTIKGTTEIEGSVFGGGAQSAVSGNTTVKLQENAQVGGNVFGGGDQGVVQGSATVNIEDED